MGDGGFWHNGLNSGITNAVIEALNGILQVAKRMAGGYLRLAAT